MIDQRGHDPEVRAWLRDQRRRNLSPGTIEKRESVARRLVAHAGVPLLEVTLQGDTPMTADSANVAFAEALAVTVCPGDLSNVVSG